MAEPNATSPGAVPVAPPPAPPGKEPKERRFRISVAAVMGTGFGALVLVIVAVVLGGGLWIASTNTFTLLRDKAEAGITMLVQRTERELNPAREQVAYLSRLIESGELDPSDKPRMADFLIGALASTPQVRGLAYIDTQFDVLRVVRPRQGGIEVGLVNWSDDPDTVSRMEEARAASRPYWGELIWSRQAQSTLINLRAPVRYAGKFRGLLVAIVTVRDLSRFLSRQAGPLGGNSFILYGDRYVLAHRSMAEGQYKLSEKQPLPELGDVGDPALAAMWNEKGRGGLVMKLTGDTRGHSVQTPNGQFVYLYRQVDRYGAVPWTIGSYFNTSEEIGREVNRLIMAAIAGGIILVLSVIAAVYFGRRMSRPIRALASAARNVGSLDLSQIAQLRRSKLREIDEAATAFNSMVGGLRWFETYVPRTLVRQLINSDDGALVRSEEREITVMFTDIVAFTGLVERMSASDAASILNDHFALLAGCVEEEMGTIDKYMGDSMMAFWGAPARMSDHVERACRAALAIRTAIAADNERRARRGDPPIKVRIGLHTGRAIVGNIGAPSRINYTLVGDTVNVAQRLQDLGHELGDKSSDVTIIASASVVARAGSKFKVTGLGEHVLRGRDERADVYRLD